LARAVAERRYRKAVMVMGAQSAAAVGPVIGHIEDDHCMRPTNSPMHPAMPSTAFSPPPATTCVIR
jgi:hypothetical protein